MASARTTDYEYSSAIHSGVHKLVHGPHMRPCVPYPFTHDAFLHIKQHDPRQSLCKF